MEEIKQAASPIVNWLKQHWISILLVVVIVGLMYKTNEQSKSYNELFTQLHEQTVEHQEQIDGLRQIVQQEQEQQERLIEQFHTEIARIETQYQTTLDNIASQRTTRQVRIIHDAAGDPTTLTTATTQVFGIPVDNGN
jgi:DNA anti-recombination protein RmuC